MNLRYSIFGGLIAVAAVVAWHLLPSDDDRVDRSDFLAKSSDDRERKWQAEILSQAASTFEDGVPGDSENTSDSHDVTRNENISIPAAKSKAISNSSGSGKMRLISYKQKHLEVLQGQPKIETLSWINKDKQQSVDAYLVEDANYPGRRLIVKAITNLSGSKASNTYVQVANELIISTSQKLAQRQLDELLRKYNLKLQSAFIDTDAFHVSFDAKGINDLRAMEERLSADAKIRAVSANAFHYASGIPNDPDYDQLWALKQSASGFDIDSENAWNMNKDCSRVPVAVLDTGADPNHPDLKDNLLAEEGRNFIGNANNNNFNDGNSHGTHVAGTIGAVGNNNIGVSGVCWKAAIIPIKVLDDAGRGSSVDMLEGIKYAVQQSSAKVINMSLGGGGFSQAELDAIEGARNVCILFVIAAGNEMNNNDTNPVYPASYNSNAIVSVAAYDELGRFADFFSNYGANSVDIAAPGVNILSTIPSFMSNIPYQRYNGTSMAAPHVAGAVALFWSFVPDFTADQVRAALLQNARSGSFTRPIAGSRMLDLGALVDSAVAKVEIRASSSLLISENSSNLELPVDLSEPVAAISNIELVTSDGVIQGRLNRSQNTIIFDIPYGLRTLAGELRITEAGGRTYIAKDINYDLDLQKFLKFNEIITDDIKGELACRLEFKGSGSLSAKLLYEAKLDSEDSCRIICGVIGPLAYSSLNDVECGSADEVFYQSE